MKTYTPRPRELALEYIESYIINNRLCPHDRLPAEREMCTMWGLNRSTLRSAIARLIESGRLYAIQGSGTRVAPCFRRTLQDLQGFSEYAAASGFHAETRLLSFSITECDKHLARRFRRMLGEKLYRISRLRMLNGAPVLIETAYIPVELAPDLESHDLVRGSLFNILRDIYHLDLDHGAEKTSITSATEEEAVLLNLNSGDTVFWITSTTDSADGTTIEYCRTVGHPSKIEMASILHWQEEV